MIYIIDDKRSRQSDYGWNENKLSIFKNEIIPIYNFEDLVKNKEGMFENDNIILFHESFLASNDNNKTDEIELFKKSLDNKSNIIYRVYFSGSKNSRYVEERLCMLPPDVMYSNLDLFISKMKIGYINLNYLAFGENFGIEEQIRNKLTLVNIQNVQGVKMHVDKNIFFAVTTDDTVEPPFENIDITKDWDFFEKNISDNELDGFVRQYLQNEQFEAIYIPLYFGSSYSDYMGLRLAMHIRLTESPNQYSPIFIYGVSKHEDLLENCCYDILKFSSVFLLYADNESFKESLNLNLSRHETSDDIDKIVLNIPDNIGDNHSVANKWAMYRWLDMIKWDSENVPQIIETDFKTSLFFKYLDVKYGKHDKFKRDKKYQMEISGLLNKTIVYIDDEYDKGWENILRALFEFNGAQLLCFKGFDKKLSKKTLIEKINSFIIENDADCYILDLRLHEDDFGEKKNLSGHEISKFIKEQNEGNQIVVFSASNKIWNLKEQINKIGATAYALKESPDLNLNRDYSKLLYIDFINSVKNACSLSYLKDLVNKQNEVKEIIPSAAQLDSVVNLLSKNAGKNDQDLLGAALLSEIVFVEDLIENQLDYELIEDNSKKIFYRQHQNIPQILTGHLFFKTQIINGHKVVVDYDYRDDVSLKDNDWEDIIKKPITLVVAVLVKDFKLPRVFVKKYIDLKKVRNTQIAHGNEKPIKLNEEMIVDFYKNVIYPVIKQNKKR